MKVYVITVEPYHDNSEVVGVSRTLEGAMDTYPRVQWREGGVVSSANDVWCALNPATAEWVQITEVDMP